MSFAEENDQTALETNLSTAFRLLGEQANRIDTVEVTRHCSIYFVWKGVRIVTLHVLVYFGITVCQNSRFSR